MESDLRNEVFRGNLLYEGVYGGISIVFDEERNDGSGSVNSFMVNLHFSNNFSFCKAINFMLILEIKSDFIGFVIVVRSLVIVFNG